MNEILIDKKDGSIFVIKNVPEQEVMLKAKGLPVGTIRDYKGIKYQKHGPKDWRPFKEKKVASLKEARVNKLNKESAKIHQIENRVKAKFEGSIKSKKAKAEFAKQLKEAGVRSPEEIKKIRMKLTPEDAVGIALFIADEVEPIIEWSKHPLKRGAINKTEASHRSGLQ